MILQAILLGLGAAGAGLALALSAYVLFFAVVGSLRPRRKQGSEASLAPRTRFIVLIPAHNEAQGIKFTLESVRAQDYPAGLSRIIVVADNCIDETAAVVRSAGIECWERDEPDLRGKGRALRWALDRLSGERFDAVIFIDADSELRTGFLRAMDQEIQAGAEALQGCYDFAAETASEFSLLTITGKRAENRLFWRPRQRLGLSAFVLGNGFSLTAALLERVPWNAYSIVEDLDYSADLLLAGVRVQFVEDAQVVSRPTASAKDAFPQRLRWAAGTFQKIAVYLPRLLKASILRHSLSPAEGAVALLLTSRFLIAYLLIATGILSFALHASFLTSMIRMAWVAAMTIFSVYICMVLSMAPTTSGRWRTLAALPFYLAWMLVVHGAAALGFRRHAWVRTTR